MDVAAGMITNAVVTMQNRAAGKESLIVIPVPVMSPDLSLVLRADHSADQPVDAKNSSGCCLYLIYGIFMKTDTDVKCHCRNIEAGKRKACFPERRKFYACAFRMRMIHLSSIYYICLEAIL